MLQVQEATASTPLAHVGKELESVFESMCQGSQSSCAKGQVARTDGDGHVVNKEAIADHLAKSRRSSPRGGTAAGAAAPRSWVVSRFIAEDQLVDPPHCMFHETGTCIKR